MILKTEITFHCILDRFSIKKDQFVLMKEKSRHRKIDVHSLFKGRQVPIWCIGNRGVKIGFWEPFSWDRQQDRAEWTSAGPQ